ncbi:Cellulose binding domain-containing protein, partial [Lachnospiraceae bacterium XBB1006]
LGITGNVWKGKQAQAKERTETVFEGDGYKVTYSVEGKWENGYNGSVTIANTEDRTIENWELAYKTKDEYKDVWNAETTYHIEGFYSIKNNKANADIEPGQEVSYGFKANCKDAVDFPEEFTLLGIDSEVPKENVEVTSEVTEQWEKGATVNIHIKNISEEDIESWKLEFQVLGTVGSVWDAKLVSQEHGKVKVKSYGYNSYIHPGETETIGIQIQMDEAAAFAEPGEFSVYEHKKEKIVLDFDKEWNRSMVRADAEVVKEAVEKNKYAVNVGLIDSGVNYSANINVVARNQRD